MHSGGRLELSKYNLSLSPVYYMEYKLSTIHRSQQQGGVLALSSEDLATTRIQDRFHRLATDDKTYRAIPELNSTTILANVIRNNQTVRYKGLIQDIFDIEYFVGMMRGSGNQARYMKYRDIDDIALGSGEDIVMERLPFYCIPIPGENGWSIDHCRQADPASIRADRKRALEDEDAGGVGTILSFILY